MIMKRAEPGETADGELPYPVVERHRRNVSLVAAGVAEGKAVAAKKSWGGRRRGNLSVPKESRFILRWERKALRHRAKINSHFGGSVRPPAARNEDGAY
jgi:hypothetical protein